MTLPTEPIGSIPRPDDLIDAVARDPRSPAVMALYESAVRETIQRFEETGSPVLSDGEQRKYHNFWTYAVQDLPNTAPDGFRIPFAAGHERRMPRLTAAPFRYARRADDDLRLAKSLTDKPIKQAVISPSALSLMYPTEGIPGYSRDQFIADLIDQCEAEIRACLDLGAHVVQVDFTEARLAMKIDPSGRMLESFIALNNLALDRFTPAERRRLGVHACPGGDRDSTHSADVDWSSTLPRLFELHVSQFYVSLAGERERERVLDDMRSCLLPGQTLFVGVIAPIDPRVESPEEVRDRVLEAARHIPVGQLGTTDDCGFAPFSDDRSTSRDTAFRKIRSRVLGTAMASRELGLDG